MIPYVTAGDPDLATTSKILQLLDRCGADVIELGVPFFDAPLDGPVIKVSFFYLLFFNFVPLRQIFNILLQLQRKEKQFLTTYFVIYIVHALKHTYFQKNPSNFIK